MAETPRYAWKIITPHDLLKKAKREFARFEAAHIAGEPDQGDHALNCAIACWHMTDWLWNAQCSLWKSKGVTSIGTLRNRLYQRPGGDAIRICADLANGLKHMSVSNPKADIETFVSGSDILDTDMTALMNKDNPRTREDGSPIAHTAVVPIRDKQPVLKVQTEDGPTRVHQVLKIAINLFDEFMETEAL